MNTQEVFDKVVKHLLTQGKKSDDKAMGCRYRHHGLKCAVGALIKDKFYGFDLEGIPLSLLGENDANPVWEACVLSGVKNNSKNEFLLVECQRIHDSLDPIQWEADLRDLAEKLQLIFPENWRS